MNHDASDENESDARSLQCVRSTRKAWSQKYFDKIIDENQHKIQKIS